MLKSMKFLLLALSIFGRCTHLTNAVPLVSNTFRTYGDGDDDDSEVIEIISNALENPKAAMPSNPEDIIDLSFNGSALFGTPDIETTAALVANYTPESSNVNPEELGSYLEGDILVPTTNGAFLTKNGVDTLSSRWPNGIVPFEIRGNFNARDMATIESAMEQYHTRTCIRFVPRSTETDYISIVSGNSGCWSSVGRVGGKQELNLQSSGCLSKHGTAIHELMHALGFLHEQNREERDNFVTIQYQNIQPDALSNFEKAKKTLAFGVPYDYGSVMHYSPNAFSSNGRPTIIATQPGAVEQMGQRDGFSAFDVEKLNQMYGCRQGGGSVPAPYRPIAPVPVPSMPGPAPDNNIISSFLGGLISGLGIGDEQTPLSSET